MTDVLFEITEDKLETGMRGFPVGYCTTSSVDPEKGLFYMGCKVSELCDLDPENVIFLLHEGRLGSDLEVKRFSENLKKRAHLQEKVIQHIRSLPKEGHPMQLFAAALLILGMLEGANDYRQDCLNVIAKVPLLVAELITYQAGWEMRPSKPELGYMENFAQMLGVPNADLKILTRVLKLFNVLHYDHGGGNLSAFIGKGIASGLQDMYGSLSGAMSALGGPRHGKANQDCLEFVKEVLDEVGEKATASQVNALIRHRLENHQLIYGFGHAVLRVEDPRATVFYALAKKHFPDNPLVKIALLLRQEGPKVLGENPNISDPFPNVDAISGTVLAACGFDPQYNTVLFGLSRVIGIARQIVYERCEAREGKGLPIIRPKYLYRS